MLCRGEFIKDGLAAFVCLPVFAFLRIFLVICTNTVPAGMCNFECCLAKLRLLSSVPAILYVVLLAVMFVIF